MCIKFLRRPNLGNFLKSLNFLGMISESKFEDNVIIATLDSIRCRKMRLFLSFCETESKAEY